MCVVGNRRRVPDPAMSGSEYAIDASLHMALAYTADSTVAVRLETANVPMLTQCPTLPHDVCARVGLM